MINANDLRVGNKIKRISTGAICTVNWGIIKDAEEGNVRDYEPIIITAEILSKCGFFYTDKDLHDNRLMYISCGARIAICYNNGNGSECSLFQDNKLIDLAAGRCKYLHQLQNLYKCLSGEELKVNL